MWQESTQSQLDAIRSGFFDLIPEETVKVFSMQELDLLINGKEDIDVDEIQSGCIYNGGYDINSKEVALFWQAMKKWTVEERGNVLRFITGTSRVPLDGFDPVFTITKASDVGSGFANRSHLFQPVGIAPVRKLRAVGRKDAVRNTRKQRVSHDVMDDGNMRGLGNKYSSLKT